MECFSIFLLSWEHHRIAWSWVSAADLGRVLVYFVLLWDLDLVWSWLCFDLELVLVVNEVFGIWNWFGAGPGVAWNRCWK
ncbi:hypothetical protein U1Q18_012100, partial [Sarracenia purpurea var. burkii]